MTTILTPRTFATRRICFTLNGYEKVANLIKKYGCPVSKVSDVIINNNIKTVIYFDIPLEAKEQFLNEEQALGRDQSENTATK